MCANVLSDAAAFIGAQGSCEGMWMQVQPWLELARSERRQATSSNSSTSRRNKANRAHVVTSMAKYVHSLKWQHDHDYASIAHAVGIPVVADQAAADAMATSAIAVPVECA